jgi:Hint module
MDQLSLGDLVRTMTGTFTPVLSFAHRDMTAPTIFLELQTNSSTLHVSPDHLLYVNGYITNAASIVVGDELVGADDRLHIVENVHRETYEGAFAPVTKAGTLLVADIAVSSYVKVLNKIPSSFQHVIWHIAYAPLRLLHALRGNVDESYQNGISNCIAVMIPIQSFLNRSPQSVQIIALVVASPIAVILAIIDQAWTFCGSAAVGSFAVAMLVVLFKALLSNKRTRKEILR